jgi:iron(III) transport system substrate-binding protein
MFRRFLLALPLAGLTAALQGPALAQAPVLNIYSARHYDTDQQIYDGFTRETGIHIRRIEGDADQLIERIRSEGANSPADVFITVDAARLDRAKEAGILRPTRSAVLEARVPATIRDADNMWFAMSKRARVVIYDKSKGLPEGLTRYEDLAKPEFRNTICVRSSAHPYNISLAASLLASDGPEKMEQWAKGVVANMARPPQGGDVPQLLAVAAGQCRFAIANTYYLGRLGRSTNESERAAFDRLGVIFPNQAAGDRGAHVNISGAGVTAHAPHAEAAVKFLEYMTSDEAQAIFAQGNMEYPAVPAAPLHPVLQQMGRFREQALNPHLIAGLSNEALLVMQRAGWR